MAVFKCKICGGSMEISSESIVTCEYCGTQQTLPKLDNDHKLNLYDRANHFRRNNEFDRAMGIYEQILGNDSTDAEAYWSLVLCRYGIEYVEDPASHKRVPTVNRTQFTSIFDDNNYKSALQYADDAQRRLYEAEAKAINEIQKGVLAISQKEEPFDIFICYKESDNRGRRTPDSVLAQDLYTQLTQEGFKVFFARITLEDKLGVAYEPYIFAALNSAKVMVVLGSKPEYFNAVWVKNEWSRYLAMIKQGQKKVLIPAYKDMDPYDLPEEFSHLQAQDMAKLGFMQDLLRGIKKIVQAEKPAAEVKVVAAQSSAATLVKRAAIFLEDGNADSANAYCEKALDIDPECVDAYLIKLLINLGLRSKAQLKDYSKPFDNNANYQKVMRYGDDELRAELKQYLERIKYTNAVEVMATAQSENTFRKLAQQFESIADYRDAKVLAEQCHEKAEAAQEKAKKQAKKNKKFAIITVSTIAASVLLVILWINVLSPLLYYYQAKSLVKKDSYDEAISAFAELADYKDSPEKILETTYAKAEYLFANKEYDASIAIFAELVDYSDSADRINEVKYAKAGALAESGDYAQAADIYKELGKYESSAALYPATILNYATALVEKNKLTEAEDQLSTLAKLVKADTFRELTDELFARMTDMYYAEGMYLDALTAYQKTKDFNKTSEKYKDILYKCAQSDFAAKRYDDARARFSELPGYFDSDEMVIECYYQAGVKAMSQNDYVTALGAFNNIKDVRDVAGQIIEAKYRYVLDNKSSNGVLTYTYLKELKEEDYKDSAEIFKELYAWKLTAVINTDPDDEATDKSSISKYDSIYFHLDLQGGEPGAEIRIKYVTTYPDGGTNSGTWDSTYTANGIGTWLWEGGIYKNPAYGVSGTLKIKFYNADTGELIGEESVKITG